jgi:hypothetical protein
MWSFVIFGVFTIEKGGKLLQPGAVAEHRSNPKPRYVC